MVDELGFRAAHTLRQELRASDHPAAGSAAPIVEEGLLAMGIALHAWRTDAPLVALTRARAAMAQAVVTLLLEAPIPPEEPVRGWVVTLEHEVLPPIAGLFRRAERNRSPR